MRARATCAATIALAAAVSLTGCQADVHVDAGTDDSISGSQLAKVAEQRFATYFSTQPTYDCPTAVTKDPGKTTTCTVTDQGTGKSFRLNVKVTSDAGDLEMQMPHLPTLKGTAIAKLAEGAFAQQYDPAPTVDCPHTMAVLVGQVATCTLTDPKTGDDYEMTATVTTAGGHLDFKVTKKIA